MDKVRIGIIGVGNMGSSHANKIFNGQVKNMELTAICDIDPKKEKWTFDNFGDKVKFFHDSDSFYENSSCFDAVLIAVPHYDHPKLAIDAFNKGLHVLCEKPAGVYTKQVREMNEVAQKSDKVFGIMYNQRTNPAYQKIKDLVESGELGTLNRMIWIITNWYRPQSYHDSSQWRSTWEGEGGGVLLNQDPHQLDLWQWMVGMPKKIRGFASFGKHYNIEVEDDVTAYCEYENGMKAVFITTTGDSPGTNRLELSGTRGKIVYENDEIIFWRNREDEREFNAKFTGSFGNPEVWKCEIPISGEKTDHVGILNDFTNAILTGSKLLAPGIEGINGLTISNAIHLSAWLDEWVELPLNEDLFYEKLQDKIKNSTFEKQVKETGIVDISGTH